MMLFAKYFKNPITTTVLRLLSVILIFAQAAFVLPAHADAYDDLLVAVKFDDIEVVRSLLNKGIDPNSVEAIRGETILMLALREHSQKVFEALLKQPDIKIEARANNGDTAIMLACFEGNVVAVKQLLEADAQINRPGWTALHYAAAKGNVEIIGILLEHSAYIDAASPNDTTPLMMAVRSGKTDAVKFLLDEGADASLKNQSGMTALDFALAFEQKEIADLLKSIIKK
ncbi:ankyrin repeat domain-containing protein [Undibacterium sp. Jales W-56]|uniref:ankyrin repeat domain-containing protein n=1 Tax=Undibacterium sp. Jales W-56 TaxID=2897325 RepID=UPI0021CE6CC1|nr:ankyrin repeat domain-containing protein [Undibacterium sp. Jales W-56]MCU6433600.1 ankyrin repeat domain-containing protein [Undibacterium sp. Jales W-56]